VVYGLDDGVLVALDPETGERLWKRGRYGHGQLIRVGNVLLVQAENGDVVLVAARPDEHRRLASLSALPGKTWNPPALSGQVLLVRNHREAAAFELPVGREESAGTRISPGDSSRMARGARPEGRDR
jgi:outer membrane protein assembly factor BamB